MSEKQRPAGYPTGSQHELSARRRPGVATARSAERTNSAARDGARRSPALEGGNGRAVATVSPSHRLYCRVLGHLVPFSYCLKPGRELFCPKIADCWSDTFDIEAYLRERFNPDEIAAALPPAQPKVSSLVELIRKAREEG